MSLTLDERTKIFDRICRLVENKHFNAKTLGQLLSGEAFKLGHSYILGLPVSVYLTRQGEDAGKQRDHSRHFRRTVTRCIAGRQGHTIWKERSRSSRVCSEARLGSAGASEPGVLRLTFVSACRNRRKASPSVIVHP